MQSAYLARRFLSGGVSVLLVGTFIFFLVHAVPGSVLLSKIGQGTALSPEQIKQAEDELGLNEPLVKSYFDWLGGVFRGDLGNSLRYTDVSVTSVIGDALPVTLELVILASLMSLLVAVPVGVVSGLRPNSPVDYLIRTATLFGLAVPQFWLAIVGLIFLASWFHYSPPIVYSPLTSDPVKNLEGMYLPALILAVSMISGLARMIRSSVLEVVGQDYVDAARAKGLGELTVTIRYILRNSLIPVVTLFGSMLVFLISGALIVELVFNLPGMGLVTLQAIQARDYTIVQGTALVMGALVVAANLVIDYAYGVIDPRIKVA